MQIEVECLDRAAKRNRHNQLQIAIIQFARYQVTRCERVTAATAARSEAAANNGAIVLTSHVSSIYS